MQHYTYAVSCSCIQSDEITSKSYSKIINRDHFSFFQWLLYLSEEKGTEDTIYKCRNTSSDLFSAFAAMLARENQETPNSGREYV